MSCEIIDAIKDCSVSEMEEFLRNISTDKYIRINGNMYMVNKDLRDELEYLVRRAIGIVQSIEESANTEQ
jgi:uncharacterized protein YpbB